MPRLTRHLCEITRDLPPLGTNMFSKCSHWYQKVPQEETYQKKLKYTYVQESIKVYPVIKVHQTVAGFNKNYQQITNCTHFHFAWD